MPQTRAWMPPFSQDIEARWPLFRKFRDVFGNTRQIGLNLLMSADAIHTAALDLALPRIRAAEPGRSPVEGIPLWTR